MREKGVKGGERRGEGEGKKGGRRERGGGGGRMEGKMELQTQRKTRVNGFE